jgi:hypothetical protein
MVPVGALDTVNPRRAIRYITCGTPFGYPWSPFLHQQVGEYSSVFPNFRFTLRELW